MRAPTLYTLFLFLFLLQPAKAQIKINEVMALNNSGAYNPVKEEPGDWIEIYNGSGYFVDLSGYFLSDDPDDPFKWSFPPKTYISPRAYHLVWADGTNSTLYGSHTNFKLDINGETILLHNRSGVLYDSLSFPAMHEDISYGFSMDGSRLYFKDPTPGTANDNGTGFLYSGGVAFDPPPAIQSGPVEVHMTSDTPGGSIRYTLDGSPPGPDDPIYTNPIVVSENSVIRAQLWQDGFEPGAISTASYIIGEGFTLPVVSIATDPFNLFDDENGIYVEGTNGRTGYCMEVPVNWNMDWERPLSFEYFDLEGVRRVQHDGGTKIHGGCSRTAPMKSLAIFARSKYGSSKIEYPFFAQKEADSFKGLILRNSGNDNQYTYFRDGMIQAVVEPVMDVDAQAYEPVQLFLNGAYWGIHNIREKVNEHWVTSNYGIPDENVDFIKNQSEVFAGTMDGYDSLNNFFHNNSLEPDENFKFVEDRIDLHSYTDYLFTQLFFANRDWPGNNQKYWRDRVNGSKWRHILFDLDFTMGIYNFDPAIDMFTFSTAPDLEDWPNPAWATLPIRKLLENESYREQFIQKYLVHLNTTFQPERVNSVIDSFYYRLYDIFPAHVERWNRPWGGIDQWHFHVDQLRLFANERPDHVRENMRNFFALGREIKLEIEPTEESGQIMVNDVSLPEGGMSGTYAAGLDLDLEFQTTPGYKFEEWQVITKNVRDSVILSRNSSWKYNDSGIFPGDSWKTNSYDDSFWQEGLGELGYGDGGESTLLDFGTDTLNKHISYYFRHMIDIQNPENFGELALDMLQDDGAVVYLNGVEVFRNNMPSGDVFPETLALTSVGGDDENRYFRYPIPQGSLVSGPNLIAVELHQNQGASSDLGFDLELSGMVQDGLDTLFYENSRLTLKFSAETSIKAITGTVELNPDIQIFINEFMASNQGTYTDEYGENEDWVELYNAGENEVDLSGFYFTDNPDEPAKWQIPKDDEGLTRVSSKDHILFFADKDTAQGPLHMDFKLSAAGEFIGLSAKSGDSFLWLDSIHFGPQTANESYGRFPDGSSDWMPMYPETPLQSNLITHIQPVFETSLTLSVFPNPTSDWLNVSINCTGDPGSRPVVLSIRDLTGRKVMESSLMIWPGQNAHRIDLIDLPAGIYVLTVNSGSGMISKKIMKND